MPQLRGCRSERDYQHEHASLGKYRYVLLQTVLASLPALMIVARPSLVVVVAVQCG